MANNFNHYEIFDECHFVKLTPLIKEQLNHYYELLVKENEKYNLTRITDVNEFYQKHILDSLLFANVKQLNEQKVVDLGSGAGFPGIVLKIFFPNLDVTLIEASQKKVNFLNLVIEKLQLTKIKAISTRAEEYSLQHQEEYDIIISRAVAYLDIILEIGVQMLKVGGFYILLKGPKAEEEIRESKDLPKQLNLELEEKQIITNVDFGTRINLFYQKKGKTNPKFPRKYATIKKESGQSHGD